MIKYAQALGKAGMAQEGKDSRQSSDICYFCSETYKYMTIQITIHDRLGLKKIQLVANIHKKIGFQSTLAAKI